MRVTPDTVAEQHEWVRDRAPVVVHLVNEIRTDLSSLFGTNVDAVSEPQYRQSVDRVFSDGDLAVNVAALVALLRDLDVEADYPGFVVDEILGRELASMLAGNQPLGMLGEATFHYADITFDPGDRPGASEPEFTAGSDDLDAALAAGFQTRLPGWDWRERPDSFGIDR